MKYNSSRMLNGTNNFSYRSLHSLNMCSVDLPSHIKELKTILFNRIIFPLIQNNTTSILKNSYILPKIKDKFIKYSLLYKNLGLQFYNDLILLIEKMIEHIEENNNFQEKFIELKRGVGDFVVRVTRLRLLAQFEIYNLIFGFPQNGQKYDDIKIGFIKNLIRNDKLTFEQIQEIVLKEFPLN